VKGQSVAQKLRGGEVPSAPRPRVTATGKSCDHNINMLRAGAADISGSISYHSVTPSWQYEDPDFTGVDSLYWTGYSTDEQILDFTTGLDSGEYWFDRWADGVYNSPIFGYGSPTYTEPLTGDYGSHHLLAAAAAISEYPRLIQDAFITQETNDAGILGVRLFIRGKPWLITMDDQFLFVDPSDP